MALFDNGIKVGTGVAIGIGVLILAPTVIPAVAAIVKPVAKAAIKGGLMLMEKGRELAAETMEVLEDLTAEAKAEIAQELAPAAAAPQNETSAGAAATS
jgi:hypothetical protein